MCMCVLDVFVVVFCENSSMCICVLDVFVGEGELPVLLSCHLDPISSYSLLNFPSVHACFSPSTVYNTVVYQHIMLGCISFSIYFLLVSLGALLLLAKYCISVAVNASILLWTDCLGDSESKNTKAQVSRICPPQNVHALCFFLPRGAGEC